tara:strand:- start:6834 stop:7073 length:240 start_codon:yes stop_codon:yes gene_type:complete
MINYAEPDYAVGGELITDTSAHTGRFKRIDFYESTQVSAASSNLTGNSIANETFPANYSLFGDFTSITLASGACVAYRV